jgi:iron complex transport system ATP-binding protein
MSAGVLGAVGLVYRLPDGQALLDHVDVTFAASGVHAVVGPNGGGKSTLLRLLAGLLEPDAGAVLLDGVPVRALPPRLRAARIALVPQFLDTAFDLAVEDMVALARIRNLGWQERLSPRPLGERHHRAVEAALERTGTARLRRRAFSTLSGGERARVRLAMALAQEADILLLDEPTAHIDLGYTKEILDLLRFEAARGRVVVAVLHDLTLASLYADRVLLLYEGRIALDGPPEAVLKSPLLAQAFRTGLVLARHPETGQAVVAPSLRPAGGRVGP